MPELRPFDGQLADGARGVNLEPLHYARVMEAVRAGKPPDLRGRQHGHDPEAYRAGVLGIPLFVVAQAQKPGSS